MQPGPGKRFDGVEQACTRHHFRSEWFGKDDVCQEIARPPLVQGGDWNAAAARSRAALFATSLITMSLRQGRSFAVETVLSKSGVGLIQRAKSAGYLIRLYFIGTSDPSLNIERVAARLAHGGHDIDTAIIVRRYHAALAALPDAIVLADHGHVYDNSIDDQPMRLLYRSRGGVIAQRYASSIPAWAMPALGAVSPAGAVD